VRGLSVAPNCWHRANRPPTTQGAQFARNVVSWCIRGWWLAISPTVSIVDAANCRPLRKRWDAMCAEPYREAARMKYFCMSCAVECTLDVCCEPSVCALPTDCPFEHERPESCECEWQFERAAVPAESAQTAPNMPRAEICANSPCAYCVEEACRWCENFDRFIGRKLSPVG
jgi:hypothetical protein